MSMTLRGSGWRRWPALVLAVILASAFVVGGCADDDDGDTTPPVTRTASDADADDDGVGTPGPGVLFKVLTREISPLGTVLVTPQGQTLYMSANDGENSSSCDAACAATWPPYIIEGEPLAGPGIPGELDTISVDQGEQLSYNGKPLYRFANDTAPGQAKGEGIDPAWSVARP